ncbi:MAG: MATE family efflux transporter [Flammeovirgaceae bacterium]
MSTHDQQKELVLHGNLTNVMWQLSLPAIAAMVLFGLNAFMDTVFIGQLMNETALAGVALAYPLTGLTMGLGTWAGTGAGNILSIALGKDDRETQKKLLPNAIFFMFVSTFLLALPAYIFAEELIRFMAGTGEVLDYGTRYFKQTLLAAPLWVFGLAFNFIVRAEGKMKAAAIMMSYGFGVNLVLTPIFIHYLQLGVEGAAWATNIGMAIYCWVGYRYFRKGKASFQANVNSIAYDKEILKSILKMGFPGYIMTIMGLVQSLVVFHAIVEIGNDSDLAFFAAANRILLLLMTPLFGLMRSLQPVVGINYGAMQYKRVKESFLLFCKTGFWLIAPFWLILTIFPEGSLRLVLPDAHLTETDLWNLRVYMLVLPMLPFVFMALTYLPAIEKPKYASFIGLARQLVFYVPVMLFLPRWMGIEGVYYGSTVIDLVVTLILVYMVWTTFKALPDDVKETELKQVKAVE